MSESWGNVVKPDQGIHPLDFVDDNLPDHPQLLAVGQRRSYGDVCTNHRGVVLDTSALTRFISFDSVRGRLRCESGVTLWQALLLIVPRGWFLPVTPGTSFVTVGGAVANDVHGKNHHVAGSFGCFVNCLALRRTDGTTLVCSRDDNAELFAATIGGLGLTGLILWVELDLKAIESSRLDVESIEYANFHEFLALSQEAEKTHEYHVSWVDCLGKSERRGGGVFFRANHRHGVRELDRELMRSRKTVPSLVGKGPPLINPLTLKLFNTAYRHQNRGQRSYTESAEKYFYPLDGLIGWNKIYGRRGFYQFQCVVPFEHSAAITELLAHIEQSGQGSFLSVMKTMGEIASPGMIAFSRPGVTLALDFPNKGKRTLQLFSTLEQIVVEAGGAIYPAKDAVMSAATFSAGYPGAEIFSRFIDPGMSSDFWRRVFPH